MLHPWITDDVVWPVSDRKLMEYRERDDAFPLMDRRKLFRNHSNAIDNLYWANGQRAAFRPLSATMALIDHWLDIMRQQRK